MFEMTVYLLAGAISRAKIQSTLSPPTNQHPVLFTGRMPFLSPNQHCQSTEGKKSHSMDLLTKSSPGGLPTSNLNFKILIIFRIGL